MKSKLTPVLFLFFLVSGFCGLLYQMVWIRLAFASFGIITPVLSVVISVFMLGLSLGSWGGGRCISYLTRSTRITAIVYYALAEFGIGLGAFMVPNLFVVGSDLLLTVGASDSYSYLFLSALVIAVSIFPWCVFMGATFPFMMAFLKEVEQSEERGFSFLYLANVMGAMTGTLITAFVLIELAGFRNTLWIGGALNGLIGAGSLSLGAWFRQSELTQKKPLRPQLHAAARAEQPWLLAILFASGFVSLAMEVVWTRVATPIMGTQVYPFALLLFVYLLATWIGSYVYRQRGPVESKRFSTAELIGLLAVCAFLPAVINDPWLYPSSVVRLGQYGLNSRVLLFVISIFPFCAILGYLTPQLIDEYSKGNPERAGKVYAVNIVGCILGPLVASYLLLPWLGAKFTLVILVLPFLFFLVIHLKELSPRWRWTTGGLSVFLLMWASLVSTSYEVPLQAGSKYLLKRDHTATTVSFGEGMQKRLLVNGIGITALTPITKLMAHLPMAFHNGRPESSLIICFGMGTTYRSMLAWGVQVTAVELVPGVRDSFEYFFKDARAKKENPLGKIVIDDGRRFLKRTKQSFDVITIDPPPPPEAAGSSLLYSEEFYALVKMRLKPKGILQQWFPPGESRIYQAVVRSLVNSFPYVRAFPSIEGPGCHFLASTAPIVVLTPDDMMASLPQEAQLDFLEWNSTGDLRAYIEKVLDREIPVVKLLSANPRVRITDDHPFNEYFFLRRTRLIPPDH